MGVDEKFMQDAERKQFEMEVRAVLRSWWPEEGRELKRREIAAELFAKLGGGGSLVDKDEVVEGVWCAWISWLQSGATGGDGDAGVRWMQRLVRKHQHPDGRMHDLDAHTNLDKFTYDELTTLHAVGGLAIASGDETLLEGARRMAAYHEAHTQPDHTTDEPWAMGVFAWFEGTRLFAEQQLHNVRAGSNRSSWILALLADAVMTMSGTIE
jgi:hypothetical protein